MIKEDVEIIFNKQLRETEGDIEQALLNTYEEIGIVVLDEVIAKSREVVHYDVREFLGKVMRSQAKLCYFQVEINQNLEREKLLARIRDYGFLQSCWEGCVTFTISNFNIIKDEQFKSKHPVQELENIKAYIAEERTKVMNHLEATGELAIPKWILVSMQAVFLQTYYIFLGPKNFRRFRKYFNRLIIELRKLQPGLSTKSETIH